MNIKTLYLDSKKGISNMFTNDRNDYCKRFRETNLRAASIKTTRLNTFIGDILLNNNYSIELIAAVYGE